MSTRGTAWHPWTARDVRTRQGDLHAEAARDYHDDREAVAVLGGPGGDALDARWTGRAWRRA